LKIYHQDIEFEKAKEKIPDNLFDGFVSLQKANIQYGEKFPRLKKVPMYNNRRNNEIYMIKTI